MRREKSNSDIKLLRNVKSEKLMKLWQECNKLLEGSSPN